MSQVKKALQELVNNIEKDLKTYDIISYDGVINILCNSWISNLKTVVNLIPEEKQIPIPINNGINDLIKNTPFPKLNPPTKETKALRIEDNFGERMVLCEGGNNDGVMFPVPSKMPIGAKTFVVGEVYILEENGKLLFSKEETEKLLCKREKQ